MRSNIYPKLRIKISPAIIAKEAQEYFGAQLLFVPRVQSKTSVMQMTVRQCTTTKTNRCLSLASCKCECQ